MNFYKMTDVERQILINQYEILKKDENDDEKLNKLNKQIEYLEDGYIYLFKKELNSLQPIFHEQESEEAMDILSLYDIIKINAKNNNIEAEGLALDFNNDHPYPYFIKEAINSKQHPAYNNFELKNSHGAKNLKDHKKQLKYWKYILKKKIQLNVNELSTLMDYRKLPD